MKKTLQSLLNKIDNPHNTKKAHAVLAIAWFLLAFPIMIWFKDSLALLIFISVYAIVAGHWSGWDAAGGEVEIEKLRKEVQRLLLENNKLKRKLKIKEG